jgi:hypothetical protein
MGYVPKGAQKRMNAMAQVRATSQVTLALMGIQATAKVHSEADGIVPQRLELGVTPTRICNAYDVYLNGKKQALCTVADVDKGYIKRYVRGVGRKPVPNKEGAFDVELLWGKVQIIPKGTKPPASDDAKA